MLYKLNNKRFLNELLLILIIFLKLPLIYCEMIEGVNVKLEDRQNQTLLHLSILFPKFGID